MTQEVHQRPGLLNHDAEMGIRWSASCCVSHLDGIVQPLIVYAQHVRGQVGIAKIMVGCLHHVHHPMPGRLPTFCALIGHTFRTLQCEGNFRHVSRFVHVDLVDRFAGWQHAQTKLLRYAACLPYERTGTGVTHVRDVYTHQLCQQVTLTRNKDRRLNTC